MSLERAKKKKRSTWRKVTQTQREHANSNGGPQCFTSLSRCAALFPIKIKDIKIYKFRFANKSKLYHKKYVKYIRVDDKH